MNAVPLKLESVETRAVTIPTDGEEADGTLEWSQTTVVIVEACAAGLCGIGYSYGDAAAVGLIRETLVPAILDRDAFATAACWLTMIRAVRNIGRPGIASHAIAAVDVALWDLKAKALGVSLARLVGESRASVAAYGSGGFTTYSIERLQSQFADWAALGLRSVKMKVGADPASDPARVKAAREAIGPDVELFVDANGAYDRKQALALARSFAEHDVSWFEEPVSSDDLEGLAELRARVPAGMRVAAGEYGYDPVYFRRMLEAGAVDVLQVDATRCAGVTGFLKAAAIAEAWMTPLSAHTAPTLHAHLCCAVPGAINVEYFYDHARVESMIFDGALRPEGGKLTPDVTRAGLGIELQLTEAKRYAA